MDDKKVKPVMIRCGECKFFEGPLEPIEETPFYAPNGCWCSRYLDFDKNEFKRVEADDFCSFAEKRRELIRNETYLLPIWIDFQVQNPIEKIRLINAALESFFSKEIKKLAWKGETIDVQWSVTKHVKVQKEVKGGGKDEG